MSARNKFSDQLLRWHKAHGRHDLPWQNNTADAYSVWLSEIMLQQTQVATVISYFKAFMARFPSVHHLAAADEQEVLALWSGLGYYARARNLLRCAKAIIAHHAGRFPQSAQALSLLPGIGPSTAAAIASIVYGERAAILDGNVKRVLARLACATEPWGSAALHQRLLPMAQTLLPSRSTDMPRYTQAIMDLGATICTAKNPLCDRCPVRIHCCAGGSQKASQFPRPRQAKAVPSMQLFWVVPLNHQAVWLNLRPSSGVWGGLWTPWQLDLQKMPRHWATIRAALSQEHRMVHRLTHRELQISAALLWLDDQPKAQLAQIKKILPSSLRRFTWAQVFHQPLPTPAKKLLLKLCPSGTAPGAAPRRRTGP